MKLKKAQLGKILSVFDFNQADLARILRVSRPCVNHWLQGHRKISGCHREVLQALYNVACEVEHDEKRREKVARMLSLGIAGLIFQGLTR